MHHNVVDGAPMWLFIHSRDIHDELIESNWHRDASGEKNVGTRTVVRNNTAVPHGAPFPPEALAVMAAAGPAWWAGPR